MVNIIEGNQPAGIKAYTSQRSRLRENAKPSGSSTGLTVGEDRVLLSPLAKEIQMAQSQLQDVPDVRADKVAQIKQQIEEGTYSVSSEKIANRMMGESLLNEIL